MDRSQMIQNASQMKKLRYNNHPNRAGSLDLTLRLGLSNHDYYHNNLNEIGQSLNSNHFNPQQPPMQQRQYNNMVSEDHSTGISNMIINNGGPNNYNNFFEGFNQTGIDNMGQIIKTGAGADQILSGPKIHSPPNDNNSSNFNANIVNNKLYTSSAFSPRSLIKLSDYNNDILLKHNDAGTAMNNDGTGRGKPSSRRKNNRQKKQRRNDNGDDDDQKPQARAEAVVDAAEEQQEEEEVLEDEHDIDQGDHDASKRCSNADCGTRTTPMWRRGPLGPKSLCNACGIKYRRQEEIRKAVEIAEAKARNSLSIGDVY